MEKAFILFMSGGLYFMVPLEHVVSVESRESAEAMELSVFDFGQACSLCDRPVWAPYILVMCFQEVKIGVAVEWVEGIKELDENDLYKLEAPVIGQDNQYLDSAVALKAMKPPLAYVLRMQVLFEKLQKNSEAILE
ncbi:hypothetical protein ACH52_0307 [Eubacterium limosum]|nr:hypothetical protein ACH52_0307 [Eubacterium limosum]